MKLQLKGFGLRRGLFDKEVEEWANLALVLETRHHSHGNDTLLWKLDKFGVLHLKKRESMLDEELCIQLWAG